MWWQIIPPMAIIGGAVGVQFASMGVIHYAFTGRPSARGYTEATDYEFPQKLAYRRDTFNVGNEYEGRGLEYIEDED